MNNFTKKLSWLIMSMMLLVSGSVWADNETINFVGWNFDGADSWATSYTQRTVTTSLFTVTFASANRQTATISDCPVTKGRDIIVALNDPNDYDITGVELTLKQWGDKAQTVTLHTSNDGESFTPVKSSSDFSLSETDLSAKYLKFTFSSSSNQVGVQSIKITYDGKMTGAETQVRLNLSELSFDLAEGKTPKSLTAEVYAGSTKINNATITWKSADATVATVNNGSVTPVGVGTTTITASYAGVEGTYLKSNSSCSVTVTKSAFTSIDLSEEITFNSFTTAGGSYNNGEDKSINFTASDDKDYTWTGNYVMSATGDNAGKLQMRKSDGTISSPSISSNYGFNATITFSGSLTAAIGENQKTSSSSPLTISTTSTECSLIITNGDATSYIESIKFTPFSEETQLDPDLSYETKSFTVSLDETFTAPTLTNPYGLTVTYQSDNTAVATVDANTGEITLNGVGVAIITASFEGNSTYKEGTASYTLTVQEGEAPSLSIIDLREKTESIKFSDFSKAGSGYTIDIQGPFPGSDGNEYEGWSKTSCSYYSNDHSLLQMKASAGILTSPIIKSDKGIKVIVTYGSSKGITLTIGEESITGEAGGSATTQETIVKLSSTATETTFSISAGSNAAYVKSIEIVPLTGDEIAAPTFSPDGGEFTAVQTVTITAADGCTILYSLDGSAPSIEYSSPITISETATLKAIAKDVAGNESDIASATYTINIPVQLDEYANIKALIEAAPSKECILNLKNAQVLYVGKNDMYVKDATGAIDFFKTGLTYTAGQILNGTINVTYKLYNNLPEITAVSNNNLTATNGTATPVSVDVEEIGLSGYVCDYVTVSGTFVIDGSNYYISDGANKILVYNKFQITDINLAAIENGSEVTAIGIVVPYNGDPEIALTEFEVISTPIIDVDTYDNIAAVIDAAPTSSFILQLTNAQVLYVNGKDMFVKDATGAIDFYNCGLEYPAGQILNGTIKASYTLYKGIPEITSVTENKLTVTEGTVTPSTFAVNAITVDKACDFVSVTGTFVVDSENNKYYVSDGADQIGIYNGRFKITDIDLTTVEEGATVTATGIVIPLSVSDGFIPQIALTAFEESASVQYYGDANGDGDVDISDVVAVVNYILNDGATGNFVFENADVNGDGEVDISDVVGIVNMILNGELIIRE